VSNCRAVYVVLGERPELDELRRCGQARCPEHAVQLAWVRGDPDRLAAYNEQLRRFDIGDRVALVVDQESLL
jgi:hypothetical protein